MKARTTFYIHINDKEDPGHNDHIEHEYELREEAEQILQSKLASIAMAFAKNGSIKPIEEFLRYQSFTICRKPEPSITEDVTSTAQDIIYDLTEEIAQMLIDDGEASIDLYNDYANTDRRISESDDYWRQPKEAIKVIDELSEFEETDSGLWEGTNSYSDILNAIAHYTYTNALYAEIVEIIETINSEIDSDVITEAERQITIELLDANDFNDIAESGFDTNDFDDIRQWCEEHVEEFAIERLKEIKKLVEEELN